jgi:hypothetical protein
MASIQNWTISKYVRQYLAPVLRTPRVLEFLYSLTAPLQSFRDQLTNSIYPALERRARYNAQVIRFEKLLDTELNTAGIYINRQVTIPRFYVFNEAENNPKYFFNGAEIDPVFIYGGEEYYPAFDFIVHVPATVFNNQLARAKALVNKHKLAGTTYQVVSI